MPDTKTLTPDEIIFEQRIKGEKQNVYFRFGLIAIFFVFLFFIAFNKSAESVSQLDVIISKITQFSIVGVSLIINFIVLFRLNKKKYSLILSYFLVSFDILILTFANYIMSIETPSLSITTVVTTMYSLFIVLSGKRYSFKLSMYASILSCVSYISLILINGSDIVRIFGNAGPIFSGIGNSGKTVYVYFDMDDIVIRAIIYIIIGLVTGFLAMDNRKLIIKQANLIIQNTNLEKTFVDNFTRIIETNLKTSDVLQSSIDSMSIRFERMLLSLDKISSNAKNQAQFSSETVSSMERINQSFDRIENNIKEQSYQIDNASSKIIELVEIINKINSSSTNAKNMSNQLTNIAYEGSKAVESSIMAIKEIEKSSEEIKVANNLINEIADQTNILAMNANIEAANAGTVGAGFNVVANEIRKLAYSSTASVERINEIIANMMEKVKKGVTLSENVGVILQNIISGIETSGQLVNTISEHTKFQADYSSQIEENMKEVINKTTKIAENIEQERKMSIGIVYKAKQVKEIATETEKEVLDEVESGKAIQKAIEEVANASKQNKDIAYSLRENLKSYQEAEIIEQ